MSEKQKQPKYTMWSMIVRKVLYQQDLGLVRPLTMILLQIYCLVCFERIFKIAQYLAKLQKESWLPKRCVRRRRGTGLMKDEELAWDLTCSKQKLL